MRCCIYVYIERIVSLAGYLSQWDRDKLHDNCYLTLIFRTQMMPQLLGSSFAMHVYLYTSL